MILASITNLDLQGQSWAEVGMGGAWLGAVVLAPP